MRSHSILHTLKAPSIISELVVMMGREIASSFSLCCWFLWTEAADNPVCSLHRSSFQSCKRLLTISRCAKTNMQLSTTSRFFPLIHEQSLPAFAKCTSLHFFTQYFFFLKDRLARRPYQPYLIIGTIPLNSSPIQKLQRANSPF